MATKDYYHDLDLKLVSQIVNARTHNLSTADRTTLASSLNAAHRGLHVYDTDLGQTFYWSGTTWTNGVPVIAGAMTYKGAYASLTTTPTAPASGDTYVYNGVAGDVTWADQTFNPNASVEPGDMLVYRGGNVWDVIQGNTVKASATVSGVVKLATALQAIAGADSENAITSEVLKAVFDSKKMPRVYFDGAVTLAANTPFTVAHNLGLQNKDAFTVRVADSTGSDVSVDVDSVDVNSLTINSAIVATGVKVTVIGY